MSEQEKAAPAVEESKPLRTQLEINQEYTQCATQYGDLSARIHQFHKTSNELMHRMYDLQTEKALPEVKENPTS